MSKKQKDNKVQFNWLACPINIGWEGYLNLRFESNNHLMEWGLEWRATPEFISYSFILLKERKKKKKINIPLQAATRILWWKIKHGIECL